MAEYVCEVGTTVSWDDCTPVVGRVVEVGERVTRCRDCKKWGVPEIEHDGHVFAECAEFSKPKSNRNYTRECGFCYWGEPKEDA